MKECASCKKSKRSVEPVTLTRRGRSVVLMLCADCVKRLVGPLEALGASEPTPRRGSHSGHAVVPID